jgi:DNA-binding transcriptional LysR family regulator
MIRFDALQDLSAINEAGSMTGAARLHIVSQSTISRRIRALEEERQIDRIDRSKRP